MVPSEGFQHRHIYVLMDNFLKKVDFFLLWMYSTPPQAQRCVTDTFFFSENKCSPVSYVSAMSAPCPYGSYFCSVFQTYVFLCIAELHSGWCDGTGCKAFIGAYDMFIMSLTPREIYWVSRMTCYLFTSFSFARFACHCACYSTVYINVFGCVCVRETEEARSRDLDNIFITLGNSCTHWSQWIQKLKDLTWVMKVSSKTLLNIQPAFSQLGLLR